MKKFLLTLFMFTALLMESLATNFTVSNTNDAGAGSLREAITSANADNSADPSSPHIITFSVTGTISIASQLPDLINHITITGPSSGITISAGSGYRIFVTGIGKAISLTNLILQNGAPGNAFGGAIRNTGILTITNCRITANTTTGTGQGGAISNGVTGFLYINNSTIDNNVCSNSGGALVNYGNAYFTNCTLFGNIASAGGAVANFKLLSLLNCTVLNNSGGISHVTATDASVTIENSIIMGSTTDMDIDSDAAYTIPCTYSAIGTIGSNVSIPGAGTVLSNPTNIFGTVALANNGGLTPTVAIPSTSHAVNNGLGSNAPAADQRGVNREGAADMGAYEYITTTAVLNKSASQEYLQISSNPGNGFFNAEVSSMLSGNFEWKIVDSNGRLIRNGGSFSKGADEYSFSINLGEQASGTYYLILTSEKGLLSQPLIKQ